MFLHFSNGITHLNTSFLHLYYGAAGNEVMWAHFQLTWTF